MDKRKKTRADNNIKFKVARSALVSIIFSKIMLKVFTTNDTTNNIYILFLISLGGGEGFNNEKLTIIFCY
jgi:hypothetical protein